MALLRFLNKILSSSCKLSKLDNRCCCSSKVSSSFNLPADKIDFKSCILALGFDFLRRFKQSLKYSKEFFSSKVGVVANKVP
ncbi:MAG: hypothetical protein ABGX42_02625, partial [Gammaproteobacteria bacterium]